MDTVHIVIICVLGSLLLLFLGYLFLSAPALRRKSEIIEFTKYKYAHRGLHGEGAAENSLTAFRRAVEAGYGIELDVRLSKDGELVVFHDDTLNRVTGETGRVDGRTYSELKEMCLLGTEDTVPLFSDVLALVDGKIPLLIELKEDAGKYGVTEKTLEILKGYNGKYIIESFNPLAIGRVKKLAPEVLRGVLSMNFLKEKQYRTPIHFLLQNLMLNAVARPHFIAYNHSQHKNAAFRLVKTLFGAVTFAWTVSSKKEETEAFAHGFSTVIFENYHSSL